MMNKQAKTGNKHSALLDAFIKTASQQPEKKEAEFDVSAILNKPNEPTLQEIFADVVRNGGKNITRTAQFGGGGGMAGMKPMPEEPPVMDEGFDEIGDIGLGEPGTGLDEGLDEGLGDEGCDQEAVKQNLVDALVALCGSPEEAAECVTNQTMSPAEGLPGDESLGEEPLGDDMGIPPVDEGLPEEMPKQMPAPTGAPAAMPAPM